MTTEGAFCPLSADESCQLLAMTPAGESAIITTRECTRLYRFGRSGYQSQEAQPRDADKAVERYGWTPVNMLFRTWDAMNDYRVRSANKALEPFEESKPVCWTPSEADLRAMLNRLRSLIHAFDDFAKYTTEFSSVAIDAANKLRELSIDLDDRIDEVRDALD